VISTGFFLSPIPGEAVNFKGSKFGDDYSNELPAKALVLATVATPLFFISCSSRRKSSHSS